MLYQTGVLRIIRRGARGHERCDSHTSTRPEADHARQSPRRLQAEDRTREEASRERAPDGRGAAQDFWGSDLRQPTPRDYPLSLADHGALTRNPGSPATRRWMSDAA